MRRQRKVPFARTIAVPAVAIAVAVTALCTSHEARAQPNADATAGAYSLAARGPDALHANPATLAWTQENLLRIDAAGSLQNSDFSLSDYRRWNGAVWSEEDKAQILAKIDDSGVDGRYDGTLASPGVSWNHWAFALATQSVGTVRLPREYVDLVFTGNTPGRSWSFEGSGGQQYTCTSLSAGFGHTLFESARWSLAGGLTARYLRGWEYRDVVDVRGDLSTTLDSVVGSLQATTRTAEGGHGFTADLGLAARTATNWQIGLTLRNVIGFLDWSNAPKLHVDRAVADSLTLNDLEDEEFIDLSSEQPIEGTFRHTLARELILAVATHVDGARIELDYRQGFDDTPVVSTTPRIAAGVELSAHSWNVGRAGLAVGGVDGPVLAIGGGLRLGRFRVDAAYQSLGSFHVFLPRGVGAGVSVGYVWDAGSMH